MTEGDGDESGETRVIGRASGGEGDVVIITDCASSDSGETVSERRLRRDPMAAEKALALVVRGTDWSETSRITTLFTREFGKVRALAKGGRRLKSNFDCRVRPAHRLPDRVPPQGARRARPAHRGAAGGTVPGPARRISTHSTPATTSPNCSPTARRTTTRTRALFDAALETLRELGKPGEPPRCGDGV